MTVAVSPTRPAPRASILATTNAHGNHRNHEFLVLSPFAFRLAWLSVVVVYLCAWLYVTFFTTVYVVTYCEPNFDYIATTYQLLARSYFPFVGACFGVLSLVFLSSLLRILCHSLRARELKFGPTEATMISRKTPPRRPSAVGIAPTSMGSFIRRTVAYTGVHGTGFKGAAIVRTLVQITVQSIQAYEASTYTPSLIINGSFGAVLLLSCMAIPVVRVVYRQHVAKERVVLLLVDLVVDVVLMGVPLSRLFWYMYVYFGTEETAFRDTYGARGVMELRLVFVTSHLNVLVKFIPSLSVYFTISSITDLLRRGNHVESDSASRTASASWSASIRSIFQVQQSFNSLASQLVEIARRPSQYREVRFLHRWIERVLVVWGVVVIVLYTVAYTAQRECEDGCQVVLYPWFVVNECRCAVQELDCFDRRIKGTAGDLVWIFERLAPTGLATLVIKHCPALTVPEQIHWLRDLYMLDVYNCSIASFDSDAAMSSRFYWRLGRVYMTRTNVTEIPSALLGGQLPSTLREIGIIVSNLQSLPDDLDVKWPLVETIYLDHATMGHVPPVLGRMKIDSLSLHNQSIASIPDTLFASSRFNYLMLSSNPITTLPATIGDTSALYEFIIQFTDIASVSKEWVIANQLTSLTKFYALGSPVCGGDGDGDADDLINVHVSDTVAITSSVEVLCTPRSVVYSGYKSYTYYPLDGKTHERQVL